MAEMNRRLQLVHENKIIYTNEPSAPSIPLFVNCHKITSSCIYLDWSPPFYDGGVPLIDYIIHYTILGNLIDFDTIIY